jgi:hypothetical protein
MSKPKKVLGWVGYTDDKPYWEDTVDEYSPPADAIPVLNIYKSKKDARKRFEDVRPVGRL